MLEPHIVGYAPLPSPDSIFVVFDRDGTLTVDNGYTHDVRDFQWNPEILPTLSLISGRGIPVAIATNQSGVARGFFSLGQVDIFHQHLVDRARDLGIQVVLAATCPHAATNPPECLCRKPLPGLVRGIVEVMQVPPAHGFMIGDKVSDLEAGNSAGLSSYFVADAYVALSATLGGK